MKEPFIEKGVYISPFYRDGVFVCENLKGIGKLVLYNRLKKNLYERSNIQYFLNTFKENDIKELFLNIENYENIGYIDLNFKKQDMYLMKE